MLALTFNVAWSPFVNRSDNYINMASSILIFIELLFVLAIRGGILKEYGWNETWISISLIAMNVAWLLALALSLGWNACTDKEETSDGKVSVNAAGAEEAAMVPIEELNRVVAARDAKIANRDAKIKELERKAAALEKATARPPTPTRASAKKSRPGSSPAQAEK